MAEKTTGLRAVLSTPAVYRGFQAAIGSPNVFRTLIHGEAPIVAGDRVLDIGCGPGNVLEHLPEVEYVGTDLSAAYIEEATKRFGDRGTFICAGIDDIDASTLGTFDVVIAKGVLHHLDDPQAVLLFEVAARVLRPGGRCMTIDPAFAENQPKIAHGLVSRDRGQNVRDAAGYTALAEPSFEQVTTTVRHNLLRLPYTHALLIARSPRSG